MKKAFAKLKADVKGSTEYSKQRKEGFHHEDSVKEDIAFLESVQKLWKKMHKALGAFVKQMGSTVAGVDNLRDTTTELLKHQQETDSDADADLNKFIEAHQAISKHWHSFVEKLYVTEGHSTTLNAKIETTMTQVQEANHLVANVEAYKQSNDERYLATKAKYDKLVSEMTVNVANVRADKAKITKDILTSWATAYQHFGGLIVGEIMDLPGLASE